MEVKSHRFVFVAPVYNASTTLEQMIVSIVGQSYKNWKIVMIDDVSNNDEREKHRSIIDRYKTLINDDQDRKSTRLNSSH